MSSKVLYEKRKDGVAFVTLNRPDSLNALDVEAKLRLGEIWDEAAADPEVRVILLSGAGSRAFCAGSDIKEMSKTGKTISTEDLQRALPGFVTPLKKPVIAALQGFCIGMGLTLACHCDIRIAADHAVLGFPEVKHGMLSGISAVRLPFIILRVWRWNCCLQAKRYPPPKLCATGWSTGSQPVTYCRKRKKSRSR